VPAENVDDPVTSFLDVSIARSMCPIAATTEYGLAETDDARLR
jgi:hypothetical protein